MRNVTLDTRLLLSWGVVVAIIALIAMVLLTPVLAKFSAYDAEISRDARMLQKLQSIVDSKAYIFQVYDEFENRGFGKWVYEAGQSPEQISLDIQKRVADIVAHHGATVQTVKPQSGRGDQYRASGIRINFIGSIESMMNIIHEIERSEPLMLIEEMDLKQQWQRKKVRRGKRQVTLREGEQLMLTQLTVMSYAPQGDKERK